jgi:hypothetical protein
MADTTAPDPVTARLEEIRQRNDCAVNGYIQARMSAQDVPALVAAVEAALALADGWLAQKPPPHSAAEVERAANGYALRVAITKELPGEDG